MDHAVKHKHFHYVAHKDVAAFEAKGWRQLNDLNGTHHGFHATLMIYEGEHEPD